MALIETWVDCYLGSLVKIQYLDGNVFSMDNQGNLVGVCVYDKNGNEADITGTVTAHVIRPDGNTVAVVGSRDGNKCYVTLPQAAYAYPGTVAVILKLTSGSTVTTLAGIVTNIYQSITGSTVDPGTIIPSIQSLISSIDTAVASIPADYSALWTSLAPAFSTSTNYVAGQYTTYNAGVYRFTTDHSAGSWNASHVVAVNIGGELRDLKSAFDAVTSDTRNINNSPLGRWGNASDGKVYSRDDKYFGMETFILVTAGESYTVSKGGISSDNSIGFTYLFNDDNNQVIDRAGYQNDITRTLTAPTGATKLNVFYYSSSTITLSDDAYIQIEEGTRATEYMPPKTADDFIAREEIEKLPPPFKVFAVIGNTENLDNIDALGAYRWNTDSIPVNSPVNKAARMINIPTDADSGTGRIQIVITSDTVMIIRYRITTNWSAWVELASKSYVDSRLNELFIDDGTEWEG